MGGKGFLIAILIIVAAVAADQYFNFGYYTDGAGPCSIKSSRRSGSKVTSP